MLKKRFVLPLIAAILTFSVPFSALAQDTPTEVPAPTAEVTPEPTAVPPTDPPTDVLPPNTETPQDILGIVIAALFGGSVTIGGSLFVTALVGLIKMIVPESVISGVALKNIVSLAVWVLYSLAIHFGFGTQFQGVAAWLTPILVSAAPLVGVLIGSHGLYGLAKNAGVPILGYQRASSKSLG